MPASSAETRNRWRKRKRGRKPKPQSQDDEDLEDDEEEQDDESDEQQHHQNPNPNCSNNPADAIDTELLSEDVVRISDFPAVVRHMVNRPHLSVMAIVDAERASQCGESRGNGVVLENISYGQVRALSVDGCSSGFVITPPEIVEGRGVVKRFGSDRVLVVPMHAEWFSPNSVHRLERQVVPHFFSGKTNQTPEKYMECRNWIVAKSMENPEKRLSLTDCHVLVSGISIDDMSRIFRFLDHWGIINYCATGPHNETQNDGPCLNEDSNGELSLSVAGFKSIDSLIQFDKPKCRLKPADVHGEEVSDLDIEIRERLTENQCNYCSRPLPILYYESQKEVDVLLCSDCFTDGRYVTGHSSLDFVRIDPTKDYGDQDGESWTDQETLLLLEAMELYNENWNEIAEHVGTKSKAQCILHFLRLPIDDAPLDNIDVPSSSISSKSMKRDNCGRSHSTSNGKAAGSGDQDPDCESRLPFANSGNPVMSLVAFLASAVGPRVAAACAHECLAVLADNVQASGNMGQMDGSEFGNRMNVESMHGKERGPHGESTSQQKDENLGQGPRSQVDAEVSTPLSAEKVKAAAKAGLAAAATKAKLFADHEEREIQRLSANIINHQLKRLELKLKQFAEVETLLMKECEQVERLRQRIAAERALILSSTQQFGGSTGGVPRSTTVLPGGNSGPATVVNNNNAGNNNRPQVVSGSSSSQPFVSGNHWGQYGGAQAKMPLGSITR